MRKPYNRDSASTDKHIAFIERYNGAAQVRVYKLDRQGLVSAAGAPVSCYETNGSGAKRSAIKEMKRLEKVS